MLQSAEWTVRNAGHLALGAAVERTMGREQARRPRATALFRSFPLFAQALARLLTDAASFSNARARGPTAGGGAVAGGDDKAGMAGGGDMLAKGGDVAGMGPRDVAEAQAGVSESAVLSSLCFLGRLSPGLAHPLNL